jgi:hypothetical protein
VRGTVTPLYSAIRNGKYAVAKWLLERNIALADEAHVHVPSLYTAVWNKEDAIVLAARLRSGSTFGWRAKLRFDSLAHSV